MKKNNEEEIMSEKKERKYKKEGTSRVKIETHKNPEKEKEII
jgi:hypothetical protein